MNCDTLKKQLYHPPKLEVISVLLSLITVNISSNTIEIEYMKDGGVWIP